MEKKKSFAERSKMAKLPTFKTFSTTIPWMFFVMYVKGGFIRRVYTLRLLTSN